MSWDLATVRRFVWNAAVGKLVIARADEIEATFAEAPMQCVAEASADYGRR